MAKNTKMYKYQIIEHIIRNVDFSTKEDCKKLKKIIFNFIKIDIDGLYIIEPKEFDDDRGYFMETYNQRDMAEAGLNMVFVQDNQSMSVKGVLRGLHFQKANPQGKLVRAIQCRHDMALLMSKAIQRF